MAQTTLTEVANQIQKRWAPVFMKTLRESLLLGNLVNKEYQGNIGTEGDTVYVSQIVDPTGELKTVGSDADTFTPEAMSTQRIAIAANRRAVASYEITELAALQSQIGGADSAIRDALMFSIAKKINGHLYSLVSPSTSAPDHLLTSITDMNSGQINAVRMLAAQAKWEKSKGWYALLDPSYMTDLLNSTPAVSGDFVNDQAVVAGQVASKRFGFNILEDNHLATDKALFFHPDFMHLVMQLEPRIKISDLHSNGKFAYVISADVVFGAALGVDGAKKHIVATSGTSLDIA